MKNIIELEKKDLDNIRVLAIKNNLPTTNQGLVNLAVKVANDCSLWLDSESFEQVTNLKK